MEIEDHTHPESIDHAYFGGSLPVEQLPRKSEHVAQGIKEGNFPIDRSIDFMEKEERNVPPQDSGTYYREGVREMGSWNCCLPAYLWRSTRPGSRSVSSNHRIIKFRASTNYFYFSFVCNIYKQRRNW